MSAQQALLCINDVSVAYGRAPVIQEITLDVQVGETFGLIGLNGSGKTTLIKSILGLRDHAKGDIKVFGAPPAEKTVRRSLAYLPERFEPPWFLTGMEFLKFSFKLYNRKFDKARVLDGARQLALDTEALSRRVQTYSKGMRQKLGLLGTILTDCRLMILDEPMSGLDPRARTQVKDMLLSCKTHDQTVFLSSHILADMDEICDRVALLHEGYIRYVGKPEDLKKKMGEETLERAFLHFIEKKNKA